MTEPAPGADDPPSERPTDPPAAPSRLERDVVSADAVETARHLLGALLVRDDEHGRRIVRVVETEAYCGPGDRASHARAGRTPRTAVMFGPPGHAYVYLVYGLHHCLNVVCGSDGEASAVLIRAAEPVAGIERMRACRGTTGSDTRLAAGPARMCQALEIDRSFSGIDLITADRLWLAAAPGDPPARGEIVSGPRIGVDYAGPDWAGRPWRFGLGTSPALSKPFSVAV